MMWDRQTAALQLCHSPGAMTYLMFLLDYKESPVSSHRPPVSVSSCPLLRLHTISQSLTATVKAPRNQLDVCSSAQLVAAFCLEMGHILYSHNRRWGTCTSDLSLNGGGLQRKFWILSLELKQIVYSLISLVTVRKLILINKPLYNFLKWIWFFGILALQIK